MKRMTLIGVVVSVLCGCSLFEKKEPTARSGVTPGGHRVRMPLAWQRGVTDVQVLGWVDARIAEWKAYRVTAGFTQAQLDDTAGRIGYDLVDHFRFPSNSPDATTGFARGEYDPRGIVRSSLYMQAENAAKPDSFPYPDMAEFRDGLWKWAAWPSDGVGFPTIPHELEHAVGIDHGDPRAHW